MINLPIVPSDPNQIPAFLTEYLGQLSGIIQVLGEGQTYPNTPGIGRRQYWNDMLTSFNAGRVAGANQPTWATLRGGISAWSFSASIMNEIVPAPIHILHTYKPGTAVYPHIHWTTAGTNTGVVRWGIEYTVAKGHNQEAFPAPTTIYLEQAASGTAYQHMITEASDVQAFSASIEPDSLILMRVFRDAAHANDTCTDAAFGLMTDIHFQTAFWATKNKAPNFYK